jgi:hypothetical protein
VDFLGALTACAFAAASLPPLSDIKKRPVNNAPVNLIFAAGNLYGGATIQLINIRVGANFFAQLLLALTMCEKIAPTNGPSWDSASKRNAT